MLTRGVRATEIFVFRARIPSSLLDMFDNPRGLYSQSAVSVDYCTLPLSTPDLVVRGLRGILSR